MPFGVSEIMERSLVDNACQIGERLLAKLWQLADRHRSIVDVRGEGLLIAVEFAQDRQTREPFPDALKFGGRVHKAARGRGLLIREGTNFVVVAPPLVVTESEVDEIVELMDQAIGDALGDSANALAAEDQSHRASHRQ
jgi:4-aminobutyrate aminotransferase-like enzyme